MNIYKVWFLVHMNGSLYNPMAHRFLQLNNNLLDPYNIKNYNRYRARILSTIDDYIFSSASNYVSGKGIIEKKHQN